MKIREVRSSGAFLPPHLASQTKGQEQVTSESPEQVSMNIGTHGGATPSFHDRPTEAVKPGPKGPTSPGKATTYGIRSSLELLFGPTASEVNAWLRILLMALEKHLVWGCPHLVGHVLPFLS